MLGGNLDLAVHFFFEMLADINLNLAAACQCTDAFGLVDKSKEKNNDSWFCGEKKHY